MKFEIDSKTIEVICKVKKDVDKNKQDEGSEDEGNEDEGKEECKNEDSSSCSDEKHKFRLDESDKSEFELKTYFFEFGYLLHDSVIPKNVFSVK